MSVRISDISALYKDKVDSSEFIMSSYESYCRHQLWYRSNEVYENIELADDNMEQVIEESFEDSGFPEYKYIAFAIVDFLEGYRGIDIEDNLASFISVYVAEGSSFAKNHLSDDDTGFIKLFDLIFEKHKKSTRLELIQVNGKLITEKIKLTGTKNKKYGYVQPENLDETIVNDVDCMICMESTGKLIETHCNHKFHYECLKCAPGFKCPICRQDVTEFLKNNGMGDIEIEERLDEQNNERNYDAHCQMLDTIDVNELSEQGIIRLSLDALKLNQGNILPYTQLILDMVSNASKLFAEISYIKSTKEKGLYIYAFESPLEFIMHFVDDDDYSAVEWTGESEIIDTPLEHNFNEIVKNIKNLDHEFVIAVVIENVVSMYIIQKDACDNVKRISYSDIIKSLVKCTVCRDISATNIPNKEYKWAKNVLTKMKKKHKKIEGKKKINKVKPI